MRLFLSGLFKLSNAVLLTAGCMLFASAIALQGRGAGLPSRPTNSLSFGSFQAPAHENVSHYSYVVTEGADLSSISGSERKVEQVALHMEKPSMFAVPDEEEPQVEPEEPAGWRGYLYEKGPSNVVVEVEVSREIEPLSPEVWNLIMGAKPKPTEIAETNSRLSVEKVDKNVVTIPNTQVDDNKHVVEGPVYSEPHRIHKEENEKEPSNTQDAAESYQQLMELFSRPVFAMPTEDPGDNDALLSFRVPQNQQNATVREGSRARFEIRR